MIDNDIENTYPLTTYKILSQLITVNDICDSFINIFDHSQDAGSVWEEWSDICAEKNIDPMDQIALVKQSNKIVGWVGYDMLLSENTLNDCMEPISGEILISSDTPLLDAIQIICSRDSAIYLVLRKDKFIGYLQYNHFDKLPFKICLFAMLIDIEKMMIDVTNSNPTEYLKNLPKERLKNARKIYGYRGYELDKAGNEYGSKLINCTTFIDKFTMLRRNSIFAQKCPNIKSKYAITAEKIRNAIAHPEGEKYGGLLIGKENFLEFINWAERLQSELTNYLQF